MSMVSAAASILCAQLFDGPKQRLQVAHLGSQACQLANEYGRVVLCLLHRGANRRSPVRLPHAFEVDCPLPAETSPVWLGDGALKWDGHQVVVARWWTPAQPDHPGLQWAVNDRAIAVLADDWRHLLGRGEGLTPYGDDVLCGALVALLATRHPRARGLANDVAAADLEAATTATSAALLRHATLGTCIDELAAYLAALDSTVGPVGPVGPGGPGGPGGSRSASRADTALTQASVEAAAAALLAVGHSSGRGLLEGVSRILPALAPTWKRAA